jgi:hypothetical protein
MGRQSSGMGGAIRANQALELDKTFRRYFGRSSEHSKAQRETLAELGAVTGNTNPLVSGEIGTRVNAWQAGELGVNHSKFGEIGEVNRWNFGGDIRAHVPNEVQSRINNVVGTTVGNTVGTTVGNVVGTTVGNEVGTRVNNTVGTTVGNRIGVGMKAWGIGNIGTRVENTVDTAMQRWNLGGSIDTRVGNRAEVSVQGWGIGQIKTKISDWAYDVQARMDIVSATAAYYQGLSNAIKSMFSATGGYMTAHDPRIVGEKGPELWAPETSGTLYSNPLTKRLIGAGGGTGSTVAVASPTNLTIQLDPFTTRLLLSGRAVNTSTRAGVGV